MSSPILKENEISELVGYLTNISDFEKKNQYAEESLINAIWGILFILAGIMDLYISYYADYYPQFIVWALFVAAAYFVQKIISTQPLLFDVGKELERLTVSRPEIFITILMFLGTIPLSAYNNNYVIPYICVVLAIATINANKSKNMLQFRDKYSSGMYLIAIAVIIVIIGTLNQDLFILQGLIFGVLYGLKSLRQAHSRRKELFSLDAQLNKMTGISEVIDDN